MSVIYRHLGGHMNDLVGLGIPHRRHQTIKCTGVVLDKPQLGARAAGQRKLAAADSRQLLQYSHLHRISTFLQYVGPFWSSVSLCELFIAASLPGPLVLAVSIDQKEIGRP